MAHWCYITISVEGDPEAIQELRALVNSPDSVFSFDQIVPMPKVLRHSSSGNRSFTVGAKIVRASSWYSQRSDNQTIERPFTNTELAELDRIGHRTWNTWAIENWGCERAACDAVVVAERPGYIEWWMATTWAPPDRIIDEIRRRFPTLVVEAIAEREGSSVSEGF